MATHSSILAWRIPGTTEPDGLAQSRTRLKQLSSSSSHFVWGIKWDNAHNHLYTKLQKLKESMAASLWPLLTNTQILRTQKTLSSDNLKKYIGKVLKTYLL